MNTEPIDPVEIICGNQSKPGRFSNLHPLDFLAQYVKVAFRITGINAELMWVRIESLDDDLLIGYLENHPQLLDYLEYGDKVTVWPSEVVEMMDGERCGCGTPKLLPKLQQALNCRISRLAVET